MLFQIWYVFFDEEVYFLLSVYDKCNRNCKYPPSPLENVKCYAQVDLFSKIAYFVFEFF